MKKIITTILYALFLVFVLVLSLRGTVGNPTDRTLSDPQWKDEGPLELSPERGRFALLYSVVEDHSFSFSLPVAKFITPDLGYINGKYVSLFAPGVSFIAIPGYLVGKLFGASQVGAFATVAVFAFLNAFLVRANAMALSVRALPATIASVVFLFATPAFPYGVSFYQHHLSTFTLLLALYAVIRWNSIWSLTLIWFLAASSLSIDYPNLLLLSPIGAAALAKLLFIQKKQEGIVMSLSLPRLVSFWGIVLPLIFFFWFNSASYGNPFTLSGTTPGVKAIDEQGNPAVGQETRKENQLSLLHPQRQKKSPVTFFQTRNLLNGFYIHFISPDRGILWYTPVMIMSIWGGMLLYKRKNPFIGVLVGIVGISILLYSMWGDPWGGWAFGSRYLIPSYAILSLLLAVALPSFKKHMLISVVFFILVCYSVSVNTLGALTTNRLPPQVEVLALEKLSGTVQKYTFERNYDMIISDKSKSVVYQTFLSPYMTAGQYYFFVLGTIVIVLFGMVTYYTIQKE